MNGAEMHFDFVEVVVSRSDNTGESERAEQKKILSPDEQQRAARFVYDRDRFRYIHSRATLRRLLGERLDLAPAEILFSYGHHGKPSVANPGLPSGFSFNLSHSGDVVAYAFSTDGDVGIDVEAIREVPEAAAITRRIFSQPELSEYALLAEAQKAHGFMNGWTRKEAFVKALGEGLSYPLKQLAVSISPGAAVSIVHVGDVPGDRCGWTLEAFVPEEGFVGALVRQSAKRE